eukprot:GHVN01033170.1.p1 GENE.GHVN01033170.1~~GHVN01033170.1.p1  ORF type:complete len:568 (+),score=125.26 GHVN01033170.1:119-1705(+)
MPVASPRGSMMPKGPPGQRPPGQLPPRPPGPGGSYIPSGTPPGSRPTGPRGSMMPTGAPQRSPGTPTGGPGPRGSMMPTRAEPGGPRGSMMPGQGPPPGPRGSMMPGQGPPPGAGPRGSMMPGPQQPPPGQHPGPGPRGSMMPVQGGPGRGPPPRGTPPNALPKGSMLGPHSGHSGVRGSMMPGGGRGPQDMRPKPRPPLGMPERPKGPDPTYQAMKKRPPSPPEHYPTRPQPSVKEPTPDEPTPLKKPPPSPQPPKPMPVPKKISPTPPPSPPHPTGTIATTTPLVDFNEYAAKYSSGPCGNMFDYGPFIEATILDGSELHLPEDVSGVTHGFVKLEGDEVGGGGGVDLSGYPPTYAGGEGEASSLRQTSAKIAVNDDGDDEGDLSGAEGGYGEKVSEDYGRRHPGESIHKQNERDTWEASDVREGGYLKRYTTAIPMRRPIAMRAAKPGGFQFDTLGMSPEGLSVKRSHRLFACTSQTGGSYGGIPLFVQAAGVRKGGGGGSWARAGGGVGSRKRASTYASPYYLN